MKYASRKIEGRVSQLSSKFTGRAIDILVGGGIVIFPTDTAFGIGCRIDNKASVNRLFTLRRRPQDQAMPVLVSSQTMAAQYYTTVTPLMQKLMDIYWPGALTIVSSCTIDRIYSLIRGGGESIGMRQPNSPDLQEIIKKVGVPIAAPSANFHNHATPFRYEDLDPQLVRLVDFVLPGTGTAGNVSTVVECSGNTLKILREGAIKVDV